MPVAADRQNTGGFLSSWLTGTAKPRLRERTSRDYEVIVNDHLIPALGKHPLLKLGPEHVQQLCEQKTEEGLSPRRIRTIRAVLHTELAEAFKWGRVGRNVADLVKAPRAAPLQPTVLDLKGAKAFVEAAKKHRLGPLFSVAMAVGLRLGEALGLRWIDVDLEKGTLLVQQALQRIGKEVRFVEPKSESSRRSVSLPQFTRGVLKRHRTQQKKERLAAGGRWHNTGLVFTSAIGTPLDERNVRRAFVDILMAAGLPTMRVHDLRHTAATLLLAQDVHPKGQSSRIDTLTQKTR